MLGPRSETQDLRKLGNFKEIHKIFRIDEQILSRPPKRQVLRVVSQNCEKPAAKYFIEKPLT